MATARVAWNELCGADECEIRAILNSLEGIPATAHGVLISYIRAGTSISSSCLNALEIEPRFWSLFDDEDPDLYNVLGDSDTETFGKFSNDEEMKYVENEMGNLLTKNVLSQDEILHENANY